MKITNQLRFTIIGIVVFAVGNLGSVAVQQVISAMNAINLGAQETSAGINQVRVSTEQLKSAAQGLKAVV